jgi:hypothetical protein
MAVSLSPRDSRQTLSDGICEAEREALLYSHPCYNGEKQICECGAAAGWERSQEEQLRLRDKCIERELDPF